MTVHFVVYEKKSGKILRTGSCLPESINLQVQNIRERLLVVDSNLDPNKWRVDLATREMVPIQ